MSYHGYTVDAAFLDAAGKICWRDTGNGEYVIGRKGTAKYFIKRNHAYRRPLRGEKCDALKKRNAEGAKFIEDKQKKLLARMRKMTLESGIAREVDHFWDDESNKFVTVSVFVGGAVEYSSFTNAEKLEVARQLAEALATLHEAKVAHCDIKLKNIVFVRDSSGKPRAVLIDFDNAYPEEALPQDDSIPFSEGYEAPEVVAHLDDSVTDPEAERITPSIDVFSLGVVFSELLLGARPSFEGVKADTLGEALKACGKAVIPHADTIVCPATRQTAGDLIGAMIAPRRTMRPTARRVAEALAGKTTLTAPVFEVVMKLSPADGRRAVLDEAKVAAECEAFVFSDGVYRVRKKGAEECKMTLEDLAAAGYAEWNKIILGAPRPEDELEFLSEDELRARDIISIEPGEKGYYVRRLVTAGIMSAAGLVRDGLAVRKEDKLSLGVLFPADARTLKVNAPELARQGYKEIKQGADGKYRLIRADGSEVIRNINGLRLSFLVVRKDA